MAGHRSKRKRMAIVKMAEHRSKRKRMAEEGKIPFGRDVCKLLDKMNGISHGAKEVFLWELVRNASHALYRIRDECLYDDNVINDPQGFFIDIIPDKSNHTLSILDNGIGMTEDDLKNKLFTVPAPALKKYKTTVDKLLRNEINVDKFYTRALDVGLSFFAAYMVADNVQITTKRYGDDSRQCTVFSSARDTDPCPFFFFIDGSCTSSSLIRRGTEVTIQLNKDYFEYLDEGRLKVLIDKYPFDLCRYPVSVYVWPCGKVIKRFVDLEENKEDITMLRTKFEGLRKLFKKVLAGSYPDTKNVVVSDRMYDVPTYLSLDRRTFEINPRSGMMEKLRQDAENNPKDEEVTGMILLQYVSGISGIHLYDSKRGTDHLP